VAYLSAFLFIIYAAAVLSLLYWIRKTSRLLRTSGVAPRLHAEGHDWPTIDLVVPVKDEVAHIGRCLRSLLAQDYPRLRITVVNDRSTDGTPEAVAAIQAEHPALQRIDITDLPQGFYGKPHALHVASPRLTAELLVFVDSDFELTAGCLRSLVNHLRTDKLDWLAVMGKPQLRTFWERLLVPLLGAITYAWYDPRKIADPDWDDAVGSGFLLVRREAYLAVGGHGAVVTDYDEDSAIMRLAKRAGHRVAYLLAPELFTLSMYGDLGRTAHGIKRTLIGGMKTLPRFLLTINALNFVSLMPIGLPAALGLLLLLKVPVLWASLWLVAILVHLVLSTVLAWLVYRAADNNGRLALLHPLGAAVLIAICLRAARAMRAGRPITWRGTSY